MQKKVFSYLEQWNMVAPGMRVLVGFSGGADSIALLWLLKEYTELHGSEVRALHVNHGIRGEEAARDEAFCEAFCREKEIRLRIVQADVPALAKKESISTEEAGRRVRYEAFSQALAEGWADIVALAHHQNDQAETMLFHLMRGTGLRGLRGMEPVRDSYIRPLLCVTREEIEDWLTARNIRWVEDGTNRELDYTRNQIRHRVLPPMEQIRPGCVSRMSAAAGQLLEIEDYLEQQLEQQWSQWVREREQGFGISLEAFGQMHAAMQKMIVRRCLERLSGSAKNLESVHLEQVCALCGGRRGSRITLPGNCFAVLEYEELLLKKGYGMKNSEEPVYCGADGEYHYMGETFCFSLENRSETDEIPTNCYTKWFDYDIIKDSVVLRTRQPGDYLELSNGSHKKLKDYLIDQKVPREERDRCILLAEGSHIIWVVGMRISERYKVTEQTKHILCVRKIENGGTQDGKASY